jgi:enolase
MDVRNQRELDGKLRAVDGTSNLQRLGGNAILGISLAAARAAAEATHSPLYAHLGLLSREAGIEAAASLPIPMVNILSGGLHASWGMDIQDFLLVPLSANDYPAALEMIWSLREAATTVLQRHGLSTLLADEGGLSPGFCTPIEALSAMVEIIDAAGLAPGRDVAIAIDMAANGLWDAAADKYLFKRAERAASQIEVEDMIADWLKSYPVISIEDPLHDEDWDCWSRLTKRFSEVQIVGDDLFATASARIARGANIGAANCVLIKLNQNGTLTGTLDAIRVAREHGLSTIVSARSGETEDPFIADLAVGVGSGQIKIGSLRSSERMSKYNQLSRLCETVGSAFAPRDLSYLRSLGRQHTEATPTLSSLAS